MARTTRIKLTITDLEKLNKVCDEIKGVCKRMGARFKGPTPLPVKKLNISTRKSPCGNGTETYEKWEMRMHRRLFVTPDDKVGSHLLNLHMPYGVYIEMVWK